MPARTLKKSHDKKSGKSTVKKAARRKPKLPSLPLLIVECDAERLAKETVGMAQELSLLLNVLGIRHEVALVDSQDDLCRAFADSAGKYCSFKVVVIIGHSNRDQIRISTRHDARLVWRAFARWFIPFQPQSMVFVACEAGQYPSKEGFFEEIPKLKAMFASPVKLWRAQAEVIKLLIPYLTTARTIDPEVIATGQVLAFLRDGTVILYCRRKDSEWNQLVQLLSAFT